MIHVHARPVHLALRPRIKYHSEDHEQLRAYLEFFLEAYCYAC